MVRFSISENNITHVSPLARILGLKIYTQEVSRIFRYYTEQEANRYLKKKTFDAASRYQSKAVPIPR